MAIRIRQGTDSQWENNKSNIVSGEPAITTDTGRFFVGTGSGTYKEFAQKDIGVTTWTPTFTWGTSGNSPTVANVSCAIDTFGNLCCFRGRFQITAMNAPTTATTLRISVPFNIKNSGVGTIGELYPDTGSGFTTKRFLIRGEATYFTVITGAGGGSSSGNMVAGYYSFGFWWYRT